MQLLFETDGDNLEKKNGGLVISTGAKYSIAVARNTRTRILRTDAELCGLLDLGRSVDRSVGRLVASVISKPSLISGAVNIPNSHCVFIKMLRKHEKRLWTGR